EARPRRVGTDHERQIGAVDQALLADPVPREPGIARARDVDLRPAQLEVRQPAVAARQHDQPGRARLRVRRARDALAGGALEDLEQPRARHAERHARRDAPLDERAAAHRMPLVAPGGGGSRHGYSQVYAAARRAATAIRLPLSRVVIMSRT